MSEDVNNDSSSSKVDEKKIVVEFCQLQEKSRQLFNALRDLPQFGHKHWQTHFGKTFDVYTRLWKFQQKNRGLGRCNTVVFLVFVILKLADTDQESWNRSDCFVREAEPHRRLRRNKTSGIFILQEIPAQRPVGPTSFSLQEIIIVGTCEKQVKFSELTLDMFRMLQALEREPEEAPSRTLVTSTEVSESIDDRETIGEVNRSSTQRPNPHKYLLYKPTFSQLYVFLACGVKELPNNGVMLVYISGDGCPGSAKAGSGGPYEMGGVSMSHKKVGKEESERRARANLKDFHCLYPEDLVPFSRKPLVVIVDSSKSNAFEYFPSLFGQPLICLMSSIMAPTTMQEQSRKGSLFTLFLVSPLLAFCHVCNIADLRSDLWDSCQRQVRRILNDSLRIFYDWSRCVDIAFVQLLDDEFLRLMILRFIFCFYTMHLHRAFKGSDYYPKSFPKLSAEILLNGSLEKQVLELASMLDVRSLFYEVGEGPPID
ncbi:PREDICTED: protein SCAI-like [Acropora digitifera]|uniref:protein SCAI-like n=1 Tax=Acropora digitifera TaxID=70779 RepID=UPI00077A1FAA|nr:PREDICTED: protein SCAI-like [Acropora digitifera]